MSWEASGFVKKMLACTDGAPLSRGQKLILLVLADYHNTKKRLAWPSIPTIAEEALSSLAQAKRDLAYLEEHLVLVRGRDRAGRGANYSYQFVGLDIEVAEVRANIQRAQDEPFFSPSKKGSDTAHKGLTESTQKGSQRAHDGDCHKEEPQPTTKHQPEHHAASGALKTWLVMKADLEKQLPADEWKLWVRPARLLKVMSSVVLLIALPPNNAIISAARARRDLLRELAAAAGFGDVVFTTYPDDYTRERIKQEYPDFYEQMIGNRDRASVRQ